ncbi:hypothetical protein GpartN1_g1928.t1 [Galdieria partita]|uniref:DM2 domain-containing protein n=1 Tax=Galdieria partita TaxID=83374 RepID=A0A9C7PV24_9RHOD|nr:hypothetical protein GpartN1_g1928.t1 [Galdieria partita]
MGETKVDKRAPKIYDDPLVAAEQFNEACKQGQKMTGAQYSELVNSICHHDGLWMKRLATASKKGSTKLSDGTEVSAKEIMAKLNELSKAKKLLATLYRSNIKTRKRGNNGEGFKKPFVVDKNMREFVMNGRFGEYDVAKMFPLLTRKGVANVAILTPLFCAYIKMNNLNLEKDRQKVRMDELLQKLFGKTVAEILRERKKQNKDDKLGPNEFTYWIIQSIVKHHKVEKEVSLSPEDAAELLKETEIAHDLLVQSKS